MFMIEITEEKIDGLVEHLGKASKILGKAMECVEDIRKEGRMHERGGYREEDDYDDEDFDERYGNRSGMRRGSRGGMRGGRYSRY